MVREGREYSKIAPNVVSNVPLTRDGLKATRQLTDEGIKVNVTLCFSAAQAILAAKGWCVVYQSIPRASRRHWRKRTHPVAEHSRDLSELQLEDGSARRKSASPDSRNRGARMGADIATMPFKVIDQLFNHPLTTRDKRSFLADWAKSGRK
jgi:transaldolase